MTGAGVVVIGAGVVGLACAAALSRAGRPVLVIEPEAGIARGVTARSSEVVHAGLYAPTGSLEAQLCVRGRELVYARCAQWRVPHRKLGKWILATGEAEVASLEHLRARGEANGVPGLEWVDGAEFTRREPELRALAALSGLDIEAHGYRLKLCKGAPRAGRDWSTASASNRPG